MRPSRSPSRSDPQGSRAVARRGSGKRRGTTVRVLPPVSRRRCLSDRPWPYVLFVVCDSADAGEEVKQKAPFPGLRREPRCGRAMHAHPLTQAPHSYKLQHRAPSETKTSQPPWTNPSAESAWSTATCFSRRGRAVACVSRGSLAYRGSSFVSMVPSAAPGQAAVCRVGVAQRLRRGLLPVECPDKFATLTLVQAGDGLAGAHLTAHQEPVHLDATVART